MTQFEQLRSCLCYLLFVALLHFFATVLCNFSLLSVPQSARHSLYHGSLVNASCYGSSEQVTLKITQTSYKHVYVCSLNGFSYFAAYREILCNSPLFTLSGEIGFGSFLGLGHQSLQQSWKVGYLSWVCPLSSPFLLCPLRTGNRDLAPVPDSRQQFSIVIASRF